MQKLSAVIIDSGLAPFPELKKVCTGGCSLLKNPSGRIERGDDYSDSLGHGTAVADAFIKNSAGVASIYCIKIYDDKLEADTDCMLAALKYIDMQELNCAFILISSGVTYIERYEEMKRSVERLTEKGIQIFSAFDNDGAVSYPAAFDTVIGTAVLQDRLANPLVFLNNPVNVYLPLQYYRLKWVKPAAVIISGSSFASAYVAALAAVSRSERGTSVQEHKEESLSAIAHALNVDIQNQNVPQEKSWETGSSFVRKIRKAVVFPWNKEIHALARFRDQLPFLVDGFYDVKYNSNNVKCIDDLLGTSDGLGECIQNFDKLIWEADFDTFICGHCQEISHLTKRNYLHEIAEKCKSYGKQLYAFDWEANQYLNPSAGQSLECFVPIIRQTDCNWFMDGKLYQRLTPVLGIFGTSSVQGKFTLQLELRKQFQKNGFSVGHLSSEPSGYLFSCDGVFPFGYHANIHTRESDTIPVVNEMVWHASKNDCNDLVIVGGQSGAVPYTYGNMAQMNVQEYAFLCAANPDVFIL